jgi:hypothetical protein
MVFQEINDSRPLIIHLIQWHVNNHMTYEYKDLVCNAQKMVNGEFFHNAKIEIEGGIKKKKSTKTH